MGKTQWLLSLLLSLPVLAVPASVSVAQQPATSPANESRTPGTIRSINSMGADFNVPLCPAHFHDALASNGIASANAKDVARPRLSKTVPALITQQAIAATDKTHIGNYTVIVNVVVDAKGNPSVLCLQKSSGYGLDAAAANAVSQYQFHPAMRSGKRVRMRIPVEVRFVNPHP